MIAIVPYYQMGQIKLNKLWVDQLKKICVFVEIFSDQAQDFNTSVTNVNFTIIKIPKKGILDLNQIIYTNITKRTIIPIHKKIKSQNILVNLNNFRIDNCSYHRI